MCTKCSGCGETIFDILFLECSNGHCKKLFDLKCLAIKPEVFEAYSEGEKMHWICPECVCSYPKRTNTDSPVRSNTPTMNKTYTSNNDNVNTQRGSGKAASKVDINVKILEELREFRSEVRDRLDKQEKEIQMLIQMVFSSKIDLTELSQNLRVVEEKSKEVVITENQIEKLANMHNETQKMTEKHLRSFAEVLGKKQEIKNRVIKSTSLKGGATKLTKPAVNNPTTSKHGSSNIITQVQHCDLEEEVFEEKGKEDDNWIHVSNKKEKRRSKNVGRGQNTTINTLQASERKKHLHVWRLHPDTSNDTLSAHIKNVCGEDVLPVIERIQHKSERGYASFRVTVSEGAYPKLCQPDAWPLNTEFSEWIWFRKSTNRSNEP